MGHRIGSMNWDACKTCIYSDKLLGGCDMDVPESIQMMTLNGDYIECAYYLKRSE